MIFLTHFIMTFALKLEQTVINISNFVRINQNEIKVLETKKFFRKMKKMNLIPESTEGLSHSGEDCHPQCVHILCIL